jgi:hypothetical protein
MSEMIGYFFRKDLLNERRIKFRLKDKIHLFFLVKFPFLFFWGCKKNQNNEMKMKIYKEGLNRINKDFNVLNIM